MRHQRIATGLLLSSTIALGAALTVLAENAPTVSWSGTSVQGPAVTVPHADRPSLMLMLRADQAQSREVLRTVSRLVEDAQTAQVVVVVSGPQALQQARALAEQQVAWPIVLDVDYATSGLLGVHAWPTVAVIDSSGREVAHMAGVANALVHDLDAYLQFAAGRIDRAGLDALLADRQGPATTDHDRAARHLHVALRLIDNARYDEAATEIEQGLTLQPDDAALKVAQARVLTLSGQPRQALQVLDTVAPGALPSWKVQVVRGRILLVLGSLDEARTTLLEAFQLNPDPAEPYYLLGVVCERQQDWQAAADAYRKAFEASWRGPKVD